MNQSLQVAIEPTENGFVVLLYDLPRSTHKRYCFESFETMSAFLKQHFKENRK